MSISTHVLDTVRGQPAAGLAVRLRRRGPDGAWAEAGEALTDAGGRIARFPAGGEAGEYQLEFATGEYFARQGGDSFYPAVVVTFRIADASAHHHVPLLLAPFGYTTYRGS
jgi:5-hydroxyisourate hydrolase